MDISNISEILKTLMDIACEGIIVVDDKGIITMVNQVYAELFNQKPEDMIGTHVSDAYLDPKLSRLPMVLKSGRNEVGRSFIFKGMPVIVSRVPIFGADGKIIGAIGKMMFKDLAVLDQLVRQASNKKIPPKAELYKAPSIKDDIDRIIGQSQQIIELKETVRKIANRNSTVLIRGESGTGKELLAKAVHMSSNRRFGPFIKLNCAAIPENLLESELFGYVEGAFTGAKKGGQIGKFELADKGTLFLDEIGDMPAAMQAKLLRVLQEREVEPLGSGQPKRIDVRIVAATNVNLEEAIQAGKFRQDLYYRLNVINLYLPSLRERVEDLPLLVNSFMKKFNMEFGLEVTGIHPEVMKVFADYTWPGNIRELENVMERIFNIIDDSLITVNHLPLYLVNNGNNDSNTQQVPQLNMQNIVNNKAIDNTLFNIVEKTEKEAIMQALKLSGGNKASAANILGISRQGLYKKLDKYGLA